jgi:hypothetical protein
MEKKNSFNDYTRTRIVIFFLACLFFIGCGIAVKSVLLPIGTLILLGFSGLMFHMKEYHDDIIIRIGEINKSNKHELTIEDMTDMERALTESISDSNEKYQKYIKTKRKNGYGKDS